MKIDIVFLIIIGFMVLKTICTKTNTKEHMAVTDDIKAAIKELYTADVSAIQNLSSIATKLQEGGLTIAGDLKITGATIIGGALKADNIVATNKITAGGRDILAELDILNAKTQNITTDTNATQTVFKGSAKIADILHINGNHIYLGGSLFFLTYERQLLWNDGVGNVWAVQLRRN